MTLISRIEGGEGVDNGECPLCGGKRTWSHDHRADNTGLDDGPPLCEPRKRTAPKSQEETRTIRARAWKTRREMYGQYGHR